jgi:hypothetical protein
VGPATHNVSTCFLHARVPFKQDGKVRLMSWMGEIGKRLQKEDISLEQRTVESILGDRVGRS